MSGTDFRGASLIGANAQGVVFDRNADLREADMTDLDLRAMADLRNALYDDEISSTRKDSTTLLRT